MDQKAHDELAKSIAESIDYHERERGFRSFLFYFTSPGYDWDEAAYSPHVNEVVEAFQSAGCIPWMCDSVPNAANLDRDWWESECRKCIREFGFTLPVLDDVEAMIRMVELEHSGAVQFIVYDLDDNR